MIRQAELFKMEDEEMKARITARNELEAFTYGLKTQMATDEFSKGFSPIEQSEINDAIEKTIEWLEINEHESPEIYNQKRIDLENLIQSFKTERDREEL